MFYTQSTVHVCRPQSAVHSPQSTFYYDRFLIILVMLVILVIQVITIILQITIDPYRCCQSYLKSLKICSKVAFKIIIFKRDNLLYE